VKATVSAIAVAALVVRLIWPDLHIDGVTLGLLGLAILPWLSSLIKSAELPGGFKIEFQDVRDAVEKVTRGAPAPKAFVPNQQVTSTEVAAADPNLSLVALRIEIEKRLRELARRNGMDERRSLKSILRELHDRKVLEPSIVSGLRDLITAGDQAAHGASVDPRAAQWALTYRPQMLGILDMALAGGVVD